METKLCLDALKMALIRRQHKQPSIHHSDRGVQYASEAYRQLLKAHHIKQSMSRKVNCYDNAITETFFHTLKVECVYQQPHLQFSSQEQAIMEITDYIDKFYNNKRLHSSLDYLSPVDYETRYN